MPLLYPEGTQGYNQVSRDMALANIQSQDGTQAGSGMLQLVGAFAQAPGALFESALDGVGTWINTVRDKVGPDSQTIAEVAEYNYRHKQKDLFGNDWHPIFDWKGDGVDMTDLAITTGVIALYRQLGIPLFTLGFKGITGAISKLSEAKFRYETRKLQRETLGQGKDILSALKLRSLTSDDMLKREIDENEVDIGGISNALRFNNKKYLQT